MPTNVRWDNTEPTQRYLNKTLTNEWTATLTFTSSITFPRTKLESQINDLLTCHAGKTDFSGFPYHKELATVIYLKSFVLTLFPANSPSNRALNNTLRIKSTNILSLDHRVTARKPKVDSNLNCCCELHTSLIESTSCFHLSDLFCHSIGCLSGQVHTSPGVSSWFTHRTTRRDISPQRAPYFTCTPDCVATCTCAPRAPRGGRSIPGDSGSESAGSTRGCPAPASAALRTPSRLAQRQPTQWCHFNYLLLSILDQRKFRDKPRSNSL